MQHNLKIEPQYFEPVLNGDKPFEIRYNDRGYQKTDGLLLEEHNGTTYTGRKVLAIITYVSTYSQKDNWVVLGIKIIPTQNEVKP